MNKTSRAKAFHRSLPVFSICLISLGFAPQRSHAVERPIVTAVGLTDVARGREVTFYILGQNFRVKGLRVEFSDRREEPVSYWDNPTVVAAAIDSNTIKVTVASEIATGAQAEIASFRQRYDGVLRVVVSFLDDSVPPTRIYSEPFKKRNIHYYRPVAALVGAVTPAIESVVSQDDVKVGTPLTLPASAIVQRVSDVRFEPVSATMFAPIELEFKDTSDKLGKINETWGYNFYFVLKDKNNGVVFDSHTYVKSVVDQESGVIWNSDYPDGSGWVVMNGGKELKVKASPNDPGDLAITSGKLIINVGSDAPGGRQKYKSPETLGDFRYNVEPEIVIQPATTKKIVDSD